MNTLINATLSQQDELIISASSTSSANDFDFLIGPWSIQNKKLKTRLIQCTEWIEFEAKAQMNKILHGIGNEDHFLTSYNRVHFEGMSLRLYNPKTRLWSIYWADSNTGTLDPPVMGSFDGDIGTFYCKDIFLNKPILMMFQWDKTDPGKPIWSQAFSPDHGITWEWNWYMVHQRPEQINTIDPIAMTVMFKNLYENFNARNIDEVINQMSENVKWAIGVEGGFVYGQSAVRSYWKKQFKIIHSLVVPIDMQVGKEQIRVKVHQVIHDLHKVLLSDEIVYHVFKVDGALISEFNIEK